MDDEAQALALAIGERVRHQRQARQLTLDQLAAGAEVSRRMVVNVEQGTVNPSVGTLLRLAGALGVGLPALVEPPRNPAHTVTRAGEGAALWVGDHGGRGLLVASAGQAEAFELWDWTLAPGDERLSEAHLPGTRELLQVIAGAVTVEVGGQSVVLQAGDALSFAGDGAHSYANRADATARFSLAVFEPDTVPAARTEAIRSQATRTEATRAETIHTEAIHD